MLLGGLAPNILQTLDNPTVRPLEGHLAQPLQRPLATATGVLLSAATQLPELHADDDFHALRVITALGLARAILQILRAVVAKRRYC